jgi:hypothetical protein
MTGSSDPRLADDLLARAFGPEPPEAVYRIGYREGWIAAMEALVNRLDPSLRWVVRDAYFASYEHWDGALFAWEHAGRMRPWFVLPPDMTPPRPPKKERRR